ncbi:MAG: hypothetical protein HY290_32895 [Planctomycetia bacterium]|nr:hypothetical protein [Planctomycetia bacterium]
MEARLSRTLLLVILPALLGAGYRTDNFVVDAPTPEIAKQVGLAAEHFRRELAIEWLGQPLPRWAAPCPVRVKVGQIGAGGETKFSFYPNGAGSAEVANWDMRIQGSLERILDSVLPHEVSHTIFACHFRRPLPRWADEGAATLCEHESERRRQVLTVKQVIDTRRRIPLKNLLNIKEYPRDMQDVLTLYAEGYSLAELLVQEGGRSRYLKFLADAHREGWERAIHTHYGYRGIDDLERRWHDWVIAGCPEIDLPKGQMLADSSAGRNAAPQEGFVIRGQSPVEDPFLSERAVPITVAAPQRGNAARPAAKSLALPVSRNTRPVNQPPAVDTDAASGLNQDQPESANDNSHDSSDEIEDAPVRREAAPRSRPKLEQKLPRSKPAQTMMSEARTSSTGRQATEWSEFPPDPRPSPLILPAAGKGR